VEENLENNEPETASGPALRDYADVGERVTSVLTAAEQAAEQIRADALRSADQVRRDAEAQARTYAAELRRDADQETERRLSTAVADAEAIRDTAQAAARRIADEGQRRLGQLREEARGLESRFEAAIDDLRDLLSQLEDVVVNAGGTPEHLARPEPERAAETTETPEAELAEVLWPGSPDDASAPAEPDANGSPAPEAGRTPLP
jgi:TPR repeat protein